MEKENIRTLINEANNRVLEILLSGQPVWIDVKPAIEAVGGMRKNTILHSGPPIPWEEMCKVQRNGIIGGILHERIADSEEDAVNLVEKGVVDIKSANDLRVVGAGVGIVTASMMVNICRDKRTGREGYCCPFEGRVGLSTWGVYNEDIEKRLKVIETLFGPTLSKVLKECGGIDTKNIIARATQMQDESHTRQVASGLILVSEIMPYLVRANLDKDVLIQCVDILVKTERFFHPLGMASFMATLSGAMNIEYSTIVTTMTGNGVTFGIKVSSLGDEWFTDRAPLIYGKYLAPQWGPEDSIPWLGDSCIVETSGLGGFAAAAAPLLLQLRGGSVKDAIWQTEEMRAICIGTNNNFSIPLLDLMGPPVGIDIRKVLETGITPVLHGGIISREGGQIGAGTARAPLECFKKALYAFGKKYQL
jgi:hypothetical protein